MNEEALVAVLDHHLRHAAYVYGSAKDFEMYREVDVLYAMEYSFRLFHKVSHLFEIDQRQRVLLRLVSLIYFIKLSTDIHLQFPYRFIWSEFHEQGMIALGTSLTNFLDEVEYYEFLFLTYT